MFITNNQALLNLAVKGKVAKTSKMSQNIMYMIVAYFQKVLFHLE